MKNSIIILIFLSTFSLASSFEPAGSWNKAKNLLDDKVYYDKRFTVYCGCPYISDNDSDGSGDIDANACGLQNVKLKRNVRNTIQWEHIVPASLMPVGRKSLRLSNVLEMMELLKRRIVSAAKLLALLVN